MPSAGEIKLGAAELLPMVSTKIKACAPFSTTQFATRCSGVYYSFYYFCSLYNVKFILLFLASEPNVILCERRRILRTSFS